MGRAMCLAERLMAKSRGNNAEECIEWAGFRGPTGYGVIGYAGKVMRAHRASYLAFVGDIPDGMCVCHSCDNRACINPLHLFLGTHAQNMADMAAKGRANAAPAIQAARHAKKPVGMRHHNTKCTDSDVIDMRKMKADGTTYMEIAALFNVPLATVQNIVTGKSWRHLPGAVPLKFTRRKNIA